MEGCRKRMDDKFKISNKPPVYEPEWSRSFSFQNSTTSAYRVLMDGSLYFVLNNPTITSSDRVQYSPTTTYGIQYSSMPNSGCGIQYSSGTMFFYANSGGGSNNRR